MNELPTRRSIYLQHLLISTFLPIRDDAKMKDDVDSDPDTGLPKEDANQSINLLDSTVHIMNIDMRILGTYSNKLHK